MSSYWDQEVEPIVAPYTAEKGEKVFQKVNERDARKKRRSEKKKRDPHSGLITIPMNGVRSRTQESPSASKTDFDLFNESISSNQPATPVVVAENSNQSSSSGQGAKKGIEKLDVDQNELQYGNQNEEFDPGDPIHLMTGITRVWRPPYWRLDLLICRDLQFNIRGPLSSFSTDVLEKNIYRLTGDKFWDVFKTGTKDDYWLSVEMNSMHTDRQIHKSVTPIMIEMQYSSDLPFKVHMISQCNFDGNSGQHVTDPCNQTFFDDPLSRMTYPFLCTIEPGSNVHEMKRVSDFRKAYSPDYVKTIFKIQREEIRACWKLIQNGKFSVATIAVGSHLEKIIFGLSNMSNAAFREKRPMAESLMRQMIVAKQTDFWKTGQMWYMELDPDLVVDLVDFIENLTLTIPRFYELCFRFQPVPGVEWTSPGTWSLKDIKDMGITKLVFGGGGTITQLLEQKIFTISVTMKYYYI